MRKVSKIEPISPSLPTRKKVAAYARVSMETERLNHSLSAQVSYYSNLIQSNPEWEYAGVYADNAVTGTKSSSREEFQRMLEDCEAGKIDIILTKSISRFARNNRNSVIFLFDSTFYRDCRHAKTKCLQFSLCIYRGHLCIRT